MSTRANVIIKDDNSKLFFYRHSDGYPSGVGETLQRLIDAYNNKVIRRSVGQSAGWLILLGAEEYKVNCLQLENAEKGSFDGWKVGAYEPTTCIHGDIEYLYIIDVQDEVVECKVIDCYKFDAQDWEKYYRAMPILSDCIEEY